MSNYSPNKFIPGDKIKTNSGLEGKVVGYFHNQYGVRSMDIYLVDIKGEVEPWHKDSLTKIEEPKFKIGDIAYAMVIIERDMDDDGDYGITLPQKYLKPQDLIKQEMVIHEYN